MHTLHIRCTHCQTPLKVPSRRLGKPVRCPVCAQITVADSTQQTCPACKTRMPVHRQELGHWVRCPGCDRQLRFDREGECEQRSGPVRKGAEAGTIASVPVPVSPVGAAVPASPEAWADDFCRDLGCLQTKGIAPREFALGLKPAATIADPTGAVATQVDVSVLQELRDKWFIRLTAKGQGVQTTAFLRALSNRYPALFPAAKDFALGGMWRNRR